MPDGDLANQLKEANKKLKFEVYYPDNYPWVAMLIRVLANRLEIEKPRIYKS